jgi:hypothetical protein
MNTTMTTTTMNAKTAPGLLQQLSYPLQAGAPKPAARRIRVTPRTENRNEFRAEPPLWQLSIEATRDTIAERLLYGAVTVLAFGSVTWLGMVTWQFLLAWQNLADWVRAAMI